MKKYIFSFTGRQSGAIGIFYKITQEYMANSLEEACTMLYIDYEHLTGVKLNNEAFTIDSKYLDHPILKTYKGLKEKRK